MPSCLLFYRNYRPLGIDEHGGFYTAHFWTLAVEEHFYLLWPMLLLAVKPKRAGKVAFLLAMLVFCLAGDRRTFSSAGGVLPQANLLHAYRYQDGCTAVGMPRRDLLSQISGWSRVFAFRSSGLCRGILYRRRLHPPGLTLWGAILLPVLW